MTARDKAILLCSAMATQGDDLYWIDAREALGIDHDSPAAKLATSAYWLARSLDIDLCWAEAERLLRDGWRP